MPDPHSLTSPASGASDAPGRTAGGGAARPAAGEAPTNGSHGPQPGPVGGRPGPAKQGAGQQAGGRTLIRGGLALARRAMRKAKRTVAGGPSQPLAHPTGPVVRSAGADGILVLRRSGRTERYRLSDPESSCAVQGELTLQLSDPAALVRLAAADLLRGKISKLRVRLATVPPWLAIGLRLPRTTKLSTAFSWRREGTALEVEFGWSVDQDVRRALGEAVTATVRPRMWEQTDGPVHILDRQTWVAGTGTWPQGRTWVTAPAAQTDTDGRPLGAYLPAPPAAGIATAVEPPVLTAVANPHGRKLFGAATRYQLAVDGDRLLLREPAGRTVACLDPAVGPEAGLLAAEPDKYAVVSVDAPIGRVPGAGAALRMLAACGMVFAATDEAVRAELTSWDLEVVADPAQVTDLAGYRLSISAARRMAIAGDAALRRTPLNGGSLPLPTVSVVLSSMRPDHIDTCLGYLARQDYPALEIVVGLHGYQAAAADLRRWQESSQVPLRVVPIPREVPFGAVLGRLSRVAEGDLLTKVDDDDHYGPHHVTDLFVAAHATGADVVAKGARFVHLADLDRTIDRAWAAPELFNGTPAGGTMLVGRGVLQQAGGWSHSTRHVDGDLLTRVKDAGGLVYRTHGLEYAYVRRTVGHTFETDIDRLLGQSERTYDGLPAEIIDPEGAPAR